MPQPHLDHPKAIRTVFLDAVGTVIYPHPKVGQVYAQIGRRWGARLEENELDRRFRQAFRRQEQQDQARGYRTDEDRERQRWQTIVAEVFHDQPDPSGPLPELWDHFARPAAWACFSDVAPCLEALRARGLHLGVASNYDARLRAVVAGLPPLRACPYLAISAEIGWRKPAPGFFEALLRLTGHEPPQVLFVGDDPDNDYRGARQAGLPVVLLARKQPPDGIPSIASLTQLPALLGA